MNEITILGIGNTLLQDEGFGVHAAEELLRRYTFPRGVQVVAGATGGLDLICCLTGCRKLLILDAVAGGGAPGQLHLFRPDTAKAAFGKAASLHEMGIGEVLLVLSLLAEPPDDVMVVGMEPASLDWGLELTPLVLNGLPQAIAAVLAQLTAWQVTVTPTKPAVDKAPSTLLASPTHC